MPLQPRSNPMHGSNAAESDFVILPRPSLDNGNIGPGNQQQSDHQQQLRSQFSHPTSPTNGGTNCVTIMQYEQLANTVRAMKEENQMLKGQLADMTKTIESRMEDFTKGKNTCKLAKEKLKEIRKNAYDEVTQLRNHMVELETELKEYQNGKTKEGNSNEGTTNAETKIKALEEQVEQLEQELKSSHEEVVVSIASDKSKAADPPSFVTQLNNDIEDIKATRLDFKTRNADLEQALQKSAAELKHFKQRMEQLQLEKQDLLSLNNELQTMLSIYSRSGKSPQTDPSEKGAAVGQTMEEVEPEFAFKRPGESLPGAGEQEAAHTTRSKNKFPLSPTTVVQKTNIALQDVLLQLQAEREKVTSLMEDLKKERENRNKIETTLMEQLNACSGEYDTTVENLNHKHQEQVAELSRKLDELAVANQEPHYSLELKHQVRSLVCELQERESVLQQTEATATDLCEQNAALKAKIALYHDELEEVRKQDTHMIETLRQELMRQQTTVHLEKQKGLMERIDYEKLKTDYADLTQTVADMQATRRQAVSAAALHELQEERDNLLAQLISAEEAIKARNTQLENVRRELDKVHRELEEAKIQLDTIPVLEAQAEIYKNDFDAERAAREKSHTERELLEVEMERLRVDNQRMQEELATHTKAQLQQMQNRHSTGSNSSGFYNTILRPFTGARAGRFSATDPFPETDSDFVGLDVSQAGDQVFDEAGTGVDDHRKPPLNHPSSSAIIRCPKCQDEFPDIDTLQIHMLDCIN